MDCLHLRLYGTILACRCAKAWPSFHQALLVIPIGHPNSWVPCNFNTPTLNPSISSSAHLCWPSGFWWFALPTNGVSSLIICDLTVRWIYNHANDYLSHLPHEMLTSTTLGIMHTFLIIVIVIIHLPIHLHSLNRSVYIELFRETYGCGILNTVGFHYNPFLYTYIKINAVLCPVDNLSITFRLVLWIW